MADKPETQAAPSEGEKKLKVRTGRVTAKGTQPGSTPSGTRSGSAAAPSASGRYTPPIPKEFKVSPPWVPVLMFTFFILGFLVIVLNYLPHILPGSPTNSYLIVGLGLITAGFVTATRYH